MFGRKCSVIGVVHVLPLPGSDGWSGSIDQVLDAALKDAYVYKSQGVDALILENMHDAPYLVGKVEPETTAAMTMIAHAVKVEMELPLGIQLLAGANLEALAVALAAGADFIRVEGFVFAHVGDEGIHESCAAQLIRRRANLKAQQVKIFADIKKKHSAHAITGDVSLSETVHAAEFFKADGVVVTGVATGKPTDANDVRIARESGSIRVLVGSGVTAKNVGQYIPYSDALIVGSACKFEDDWRNHVDPERVKNLMNSVVSFRR